MTTALMYVQVRSTEVLKMSTQKALTTLSTTPTECTFPAIDIQGLVSFLEYTSNVYDSYFLLLELEPFSCTSKMLCFNNTSVSRNVVFLCTGRCSTYMRSVSSTRPTGKWRSFFLWSCESFPILHCRSFSCRAASISAQTRRVNLTTNTGKWLGLSLMRVFLILPICTCITQTAECTMQSALCTLCTLHHSHAHTHLDTL